MLSLQTQQVWQMSVSEYFSIVREREREREREGGCCEGTMTCSYLRTCLISHAWSVEGIYPGLVPSPHATPFPSFSLESDVRMGCQ